MGIFYLKLSGYMTKINEWETACWKVNEQLLLTFRWQACFTKYDRKFQKFVFKSAFVNAKFLFQLPTTFIILLLQNAKWARGTEGVSLLWQTFLIKLWSFHCSHQSKTVYSIRNSVFLSWTNRLSLNPKHKHRTERLSNDKNVVFLHTTCHQNLEWNRKDGVE